MIFVQGNFSREKRRFQRIKAGFPIEYKIRRGGFFASSLTQDISIGGIRVNADRFFSRGIHLNIDLNILTRIISSIGKIVWSQSLPRSDRYQMGIEVIEINPVDVKYLSDYINMHITNYLEK